MKLDKGLEFGKFPPRVWKERQQSIERTQGSCEKRLTFRDVQERLLTWLEKSFYIPLKNSLISSFLKMLTTPMFC
jgi:hypothetical protein